MIMLMETMPIFIEQIIALQQQVNLLSIRQKENSHVDNITLQTKAVAPFKYLSIFRYFSIFLIDCEIELDLTWSRNTWNTFDVDPNPAAESHIVHAIAKTTKLEHYV